MKRKLRWAALAAAIVAATAGFASVFLAENALHMPPGARSRPDTNAAEVMALRTASKWENVEIRASDGVALRGWLFVPSKANGAAVMLLHGVADTRTGVTMQARMLLEHGYAVLLPDARAHGVSEGSIATYGVRESDDVRRWAEWLKAERHYSELYGLGESMGAAILLQSLRRPSPFRAAVAECPFATFAQVGAYRMAQVTRVGEAPMGPFVRMAFAYARWRYGVDLDEASPMAALGESDVPVLLIHGKADTNIPPAHSRELHARNARMTELWEVPGAKHVLAMGTAPDEYERRVVGWFEAHRAR